MNNMNTVSIDPATKVYSVHEITRIFRQLLESEPKLQDLWIEGEISNLARPSSGHIYFTLKDDHSQIRCAIFRFAASRLKSSLKDGDAVRLHGKLSIYDVRSEYQIIADWAEPAGIGALQLAFERLKEKLAAEGLFDTAHKKPLPRFPKKIGIITSATGAAIRDMFRMLQKRYPLVNVLLFPTLVQGEDAAGEIARAIDCMNRLPDIDLLIVGRGGGSIEDLWAFNEEIVARAIFASRIPIVSAIGHETDFTIADFAADHRAPTPSAAIELIVPDGQELRGRMADFESRLKQSIAVRIESAKAGLVAARNRISPVRQVDRLNRHQQMIDQLELRSQRASRQRLEYSRQQLDTLNTKLLHLNPLSEIKTLSNRLDQLSQSHQMHIRQQLFAKKQNWQMASTRLDSLSPLGTLARGYSVCKDLSGMTITDAAAVNAGEKVEVQLLRGWLACEILKGEVDG